MQMSILKIKDSCYGVVQESGDYHDPLQTMQHDIERVPEFIYLGSMQNQTRLCSHCLAEAVQIAERHIAS